MPRRGDSPGKACGTSYLFPLHYSLKTFPFPHGFVLWWSANCESLSHGCAVPAPFGKGAFGRTIDTGWGREVTNRRKLSCALTAAARRLWQGSLWAHYRYRAGQGSDDTQKTIVRNDSGGTPPFHKGAFLCPPGEWENKCFTNKYRDNPYYIQKIRGNSNLSVIFTGEVVKTTKIGIEIMAMFVYNYLIMVQGT